VIQLIYIIDSFILSWFAHTNKSAFTINKEKFASKKLADLHQYYQNLNIVSVCCTILNKKIFQSV